MREGAKIWEILFRFTNVVLKHCKCPYSDNGRWLVNTREKMKKTGDSRSKIKKSSEVEESGGGKIKIVL